MVLRLLKQCKCPGKWHIGEAPGAQPQDRGFDQTLGFLIGAMLYDAVDSQDIVNAPLDDLYDDLMFANLRCTVQFNGGSHFPPNDYMTDYLAKEGLFSILFLCYWILSAFILCFLCEKVC